MGGKALGMVALPVLLNGELGGFGVEVDVTAGITPGVALVVEFLHAFQQDVKLVEQRVGVDAVDHSAENGRADKVQEQEEVADSRMEHDKNRGAQGRDDHDDELPNVQEQKMADGVEGLLQLGILGQGPNGVRHIFGEDPERVVQINGRLLENVPGSVTERDPHADDHGKKQEYKTQKIDQHRPEVVMIFSDDGSGLGKYCNKKQRDCRHARRAGVVEIRQRINAGMENPQLCQHDKAYEHGGKRCEKFPDRMPVKLPEVVNRELQYQERYGNGHDGVIEGNAALADGTGDVADDIAGQSQMRSPRKWG